MPLVLQLGLGDPLLERGPWRAQGQCLPQADWQCLCPQAREGQNTEDPHWGFPRHPLHKGLSWQRGDVRRDAGPVWGEHHREAERAVILRLSSLCKLAFRAYSLHAGPRKALAPSGSSHT